MPRKLCRWSLRDGVKLVAKRGVERQASVTRKPCVLGGVGAERRRETQRMRQNFVAGMKGFSSWSRASGMFSRHDKGAKYFI